MLWRGSSPTASVVIMVMPDSEGYIAMRCVLVPNSYWHMSSSPVQSHGSLSACCVPQVVARAHRMGAKGPTPYPSTPLPPGDVTLSAPLSHQPGRLPDPGLCRVSAGGATSNGGHRGGTCMSPWKHAHGAARSTANWCPVPSGSPLPKTQQPEDSRPCDGRRRCRIWQ